MPLPGTILQTFSSSDAPSLLCSLDSVSPRSERLFQFTLSAKRAHLDSALLPGPYTEKAFRKMILSHFSIYIIILINILLSIFRVILDFIKKYKIAKSYEFISRYKNRHVVKL